MIGMPRERCFNAWGTFSLREEVIVAARGERRVVWKIYCPLCFLTPCQLPKVRPLLSHVVAC